MKTETEKRLLIKSKMTKRTGSDIDVESDEARKNLGANSKLRRKRIEKEGLAKLAFRLRERPFEMG
jgi:hypothetical protein